MSHLLFQSDKTIPREYRVVTMCGGIGGSSLGYTQAGYLVELSVDANKKNNMVHKVNFPNTRIIEKSITDIQPADFYLEGEVDVLDIYIPNNIKGKKTKEQEYFIYNSIRHTNSIKPIIVVLHMQAIPSKRGSVLLINEIVALLRGIGYTVQHETLKATNHQVPQKKMWTFIVGVRKDVGIKPTFPEVQENIITAEEALIRFIKTDGDVDPSNHRMELVEKYFPPLCTASEVREKMKEFDLTINVSSYVRSFWHEPYQTLTGSNVRPFHPILNRLLTIDEAKSLQTFTDNFVCNDWREICSSVPPRLIFEFATVFQKDILDHI